MRARLPPSTDLPGGCARPPQHFFRGSLRVSPAGQDFLQIAVVQYHVVPDDLPVCLFAVQNSKQHEIDDRPNHRRAQAERLRVLKRAAVCGAAALEGDLCRLCVVEEAEAKGIGISPRFHDRPGHVVVHPHDDLIKAHPVADADPAGEQLALQMIRAPADELLLEIVHPGAEPLKGRGDVYGLRQRDHETPPPHTSPNSRLSPACAAAISGQIRSGH